MKKLLFKILISIYSILLLVLSGYCQSGIDSVFIPIGKVQPRNASEIESSNWIVGCETLDRDYADYDQYKEYLNPLGIKRLRLQAGWAKTEKVKGQYDWAWLDHIVSDATQRGLKPWLQFSYGNSIYEGGGGINLAAGVPHTEEALAAWDKWVAAMVNRYKDKVVDWEVWNEPNFSDNLYNTPEKAAALNIRTAEIARKIQPNATISGLSFGHIDLEYADAFFKVLYEAGKMQLFDNMTYHDYVYNPDSHYPKVMKLKAVLEKYAPNMPLRQGENGAPSGPRLGGALGDYDWSELSQAKWNTRRMLGDLGHDIESSVFTIIDIAYSSAGPITRLNVKGLIMSDMTKKAIRPKLSYYAVQNVASIFDNSLERIRNIRDTYNRDYVPENPEDVAMSKSTDRSLAVYGYRHKTSKLSIFTIWQDEAIPTNSDAKKNLRFTFTNANFEHPVYVDIIAGNVYEIPTSQWNKDGSKYTFNNIPVYDGPILIADKSLITIKN